MTQAAVKDFFTASFPAVVDSIEIDNGPCIPTFDLMQMLCARYVTTHQLFFVMGTDLLDTVHLWDDGHDLLTNHNFIILSRKNNDKVSGAMTVDEIKAHPNFPKRECIILDANESMVGAISSTEVRRRIGSIGTT